MPFRTPKVVVAKVNVNAIKIQSVLFGPGIQIMDNWCYSVPLCIIPFPIVPFIQIVGLLTGTKLCSVVQQISANNLTPLCYSKKLGIRLLFGAAYRVKTGVIIVLRLNTILGFQYRASTRLRLQTFQDSTRERILSKTQLENESWVSTPICQNLIYVYSPPL